MKKNLLLSFLMIFGLASLSAQVTILDFEAPETSTTFQYFGSTLEGATNNIIANPNPSGVNTSAMVGEFIKPADSETFAGAFSNPNPSTPIDLTNATQVCVDVHMPNIGNLALKLEQEAGGGANWRLTQTNTVVNDWETLCFDISQLSEEEPMVAAAGVYARVVLFFDFDEVLAEEETYYFDNLTTDGTVAETISITVNVGTGGLVSVSPDGIYLAGGGSFGSPGDNPMTDPDGDGVYSITVTRPVGFQSFYTFTNGNCPDFSCKENIAGQDCADPANFNDRFMGPFNEDAVINTCFGQCTTTTECETVEASNITFQVDMNGYAEPFTTAYVAGSFNGWSADANPMSDDDGDGVWEATVEIANGDIEYKIQLDEWTVQEMFTADDDCAITSDGTNYNRPLMVSGDATVCFLWDSCEGCDVGTNDLIVDNTIFTVRPTVASTQTILDFGAEFTGLKELAVVNSLGQVVEQTQIQAGILQHTLDVSQKESGLYFIQITTEGKLQTQRIVVSH